MREFANDPKMPRRLASDTFEGNDDTPAPPLQFPCQELGRFYETNIHRTLSFTHTRCQWVSFKLICTVNNLEYPSCS